MELLLLPPPHGASAVEYPLIFFRVKCAQTVVGQLVAIVGSCEELGQWGCSPSHVLLTTTKSTFPYWTNASPVCIRSLPPGALLEFKCIIISDNDTLLPKIWESCQNRKFVVPSYGRTLTIDATFGSESHVFTHLTTRTTESESPSIIEIHPATVPTEPRMRGETSIGAAGNNIPPPERMYQQDASHGSGGIRDRPLVPMIPSVEDKSVDGPTCVCWYTSVQNFLNDEQTRQSLIWKIQERFETSRSFRNRLELLSTLGHEIYNKDIANEKDPNMDCFVLWIVCSAILLAWISQGSAIQCEEDGGHHRPNHSSNAALDMFKLITPIVMKAYHDDFDLPISRHSWHMDTLRFGFRKMLNGLPSCDAAFRTAEPLTRIRDIAHRNDIPQSLKVEIKTRLQNKLHRCGGPEDLRTAIELRDRFRAHPENYSPDFIYQFELFCSELSEFFTATNLTERLKRVQALFKSSKLLDNLISEFVAIKSQTESLQCETFKNFQELIDSVQQRIRCLSSIIQLRAFLVQEVRGSSDPTTEGLTDSGYDETSSIQAIWNTDLALEQYSFTLHLAICNSLELALQSKLVTASRWFGHMEIQYIDSVFHSIQLGLQATTVSGQLVKPLHLMSKEINVIRSSTIPQLSMCRAAGMARFYIVVMLGCLKRLNSILDQFVIACARSFDELTQLLAKALGVTSESAIQMGQGDIRTHLLFPISRMSESLIRWLGTEILKSDPLCVVSSGVACGIVVEISSVSKFNIDGSNMERISTSIDRLGNKLSTVPIVLYLRDADGDEEVTEIQDLLSSAFKATTAIAVLLTGILLGVSVPALSHLGVRVRQHGIPCLASSEISVKSGELIKIDSQGIGISTTSEDGCIRIVDPDDECFSVYKMDLSKIPIDKKLFHQSPSLECLARSSTLNERQWVCLYDQIQTNTCGSKAAVCANLYTQIESKKSNLMQELFAKHDVALDDLILLRCVGVPYSALKEILIENDADLQRKFNSKVKDLDGVDIDYGKTSKELRELIMKEIKFPRDFMKRLKLEVKSNENWICRSSANVEDKAERSCAGLFESVPFNSGNDGTVMHALREVWASLYSQRSVASQRHTAQSVGKLKMAFLIQPIEECHWSFVIHTKCWMNKLTFPDLVAERWVQALMPDILNGDNWIVVEMAIGLGEALAGAARSIGGGQPLRLFILKSDSSTTLNGAIASSQSPMTSTARPPKVRFYLDSPPTLLASFTSRHLEVNQQKIIQPVWADYTNSENLPWNKSLWEPLAKGLRGIAETLETYFTLPQDIEGGVRFIFGSNKIAIKYLIVQSRPQEKSLAVNL